MQRSTQQRNFDILDAIADALGGLKITYEHVRDAEREADIDLKTCSREELITFCSILVPMSKPMIVVANKADLTSEEMCNHLTESGISLASAASELALRKAAEGTFITYLPGDPTFTIPPESNLSGAQKKGLLAIQAAMDRFGGTGVQQAINRSVFELLDMIVVYPVEDENKYCDGQGRILPDAFLMKRGSTPRDLAYQVHSDIGDGFLYAVDAKSKMRIKETHELHTGDVIKIVSTK
jgi:ribosome-binding ATPase YchF (GTP1/OBG family)